MTAVNHKNASKKHMFDTVTVESSYVKSSHNHLKSPSITRMIYEIDNRINSLNIVSGKEVLPTFKPKLIKKDMYSSMMKVPKV